MRGLPFARRQRGACHGPRPPFSAAGAAMNLDAESMNSRSASSPPASALNIRSQRTKPSSSVRRLHADSRPSARHSSGHGRSRSAPAIVTRAIIRKAAQSVASENQKPHFHRLLVDMPAPLWAHSDPSDLQPAVRRMDRDIRLGTSDRRIAGPAHPPCPYPGDERRELSSQPKPKTAKIPKTACLTVNAMVDPVGPQAPPTLLRSA